MKNRDGEVCILASMNYMMYGTLVVILKTITTISFVLYTGTEFFIIRGEALAPGLETKLDTDSLPPHLIHANGNRFRVGQCVVNCKV